MNSVLALTAKPHSSQAPTTQSDVKIAGAHGAEVVITHGTIVRTHSAYTAKAMIDKYRSSGASGHTHRMGDHSITDHRGVSHTWYEIGCSCRKDLEYMKAHPNWQQGFLIGEIQGGALHPQLVRVIEAKGARGFIAGGNYYKI